VIVATEKVTRRARAIDAMDFGEDERRAAGA